MTRKSRIKIRRVMRVLAVVLLAAALAAAQGCSEDIPEQTPEPTPTVTLTPVTTPTPTPVQTVEPTPTPEDTPAPTAKPTPAPSFPDMETDSEGKLTYPQVVSDKQSAMTEEPVYFKIVTSENVSKIQTVIDGDAGKVYTEYEKGDGVRIWQTRIFFTNGGSRKVQYKCTMASGSTVLIPQSPLKIDVTFDYSAESTSSTITKGKTVTFTLKTPSSIDSIFVIVDDVNQNIEYDDPESNEDGVKAWKINVTFFGLGERSVSFEARDGSKVVETFPDPGLTIVVNDSA